MTYNDILCELEKQEHENDPAEKVWTFKEIIDHRHRNNRNKVRIVWEDDSETWEPLSVIAREDPVTCAKYAFKTDILHMSGWRRFWHYAPKGKVMLRAMRRARLISKVLRDLGIKYQFGVRIPRSYREAIAIDKANGNTLWQDAIHKELDQIREYNTFIALPDLKKPPEGYQIVRVHFILACKYDGRHKA